MDADGAIAMPSLYTVESQSLRASIAASKIRLSESSRLPLGTSFDVDTERLCGRHARSPNAVARCCGLFIIGFRLPASATALDIHISVDVASEFSPSYALAKGDKLLIRRAFLSNSKIFHPHSVMRP